jgi:hypothetical protein
MGSGDGEPREEGEQAEFQSTAPQPAPLPDDEQPPTSY